MAAGQTSSRRIIGPIARGGTAARGESDGGGRGGELQSWNLVGGPGGVAQQQQVAAVVLIDARDSEL